MNPTTDLTVIIISYNTKDLTLACLTSLYEQTTTIDYEVIVFDNHSSDNSADAIIEKFPQVKLIPSKENLGFAAGNNVAIKEAAGEYILLLNPDTIVLNNAIEKLFAFAKAFPEALIWGGKTLFSDGTLNPASCWQKITLWSIFCHSFALTWLFRKYYIFNTEAYAGWNRNDIRQVDIVSGCFLMLQHDLWKKLDGFSPEFFMYGEEADLCLRAKKLYNAKPMVTPEATIVHYGGASEKIRKEKTIRLFKARRLLMQKHWSPWLYKLGMLIYPLHCFNRLVAIKILLLFNEKYRAEFNEWQDVWSRRKEWLS